MNVAPRSHAHDSVEKVGVLLVNLGTPDAPTTSALRRYLTQFLSDPRVVEIPRALWWLILHGVILRLRPAASARKYRKVWLRDGSPLAVWTAHQANLLRGGVGELGAVVEARWAMRYGQPAIAAELDKLCSDGATRILVFPAYPQYSVATTASVLDDVADWIRRTRRLADLSPLDGRAEATPSSSDGMRSRRVVLRATITIQGLGDSQTPHPRQGAIDMPLYEH